MLRTNKAKENKVRAKSILSFGVFHRDIARVLPQYTDNFKISTNRKVSVQ